MPNPTIALPYHTIILPKLCLIFFCDIEIDEVVFYTTDIDRNNWIKCPYCIDCITHLKNSLWDEYINGLRTADCMKTLKHLIEMGPPKYVKDTQIANNCDLIAFKVGDEIISSELIGVVSDDCLIELKEKLNEVFIVLDKHYCFGIDDDTDIEIENVVDVMNVVNRILDEYV